MTITEVTSKRSEIADDGDKTVPSPPPESRAVTRRRIEIGPFLITLAAIAFAGLLGWKMWDVYMGAPWTRDATVRAYLVRMAPEVAGRIVELHVVDNKYVRKSDLLLVIDPTNFRIAVSQSEAAVQQAQANVQNIDAQMNVQQAQINASQANYSWGAPRSYLHSNRPNATKNWRRTAGAPFKMPSSSRPSCISRKRRRSLRKKTSIRRCGKSSR
jgi:multidrug resistance efflux pump